MLASQAVFFGGLVGLIVSLLALKDEKAIESMEIKVDTTATTLLYILSFFIPLAGFIVGAIYASKDEEHYKYIGKNCLIFSVLNIVLDVIIIAVMLGSM
jgi:Na+-driven multidrug efflux pump